MEQYKSPMTSELIAKMIDTNPTVVRRIMSGLRNDGYVNSEKGHGGGWTLSKPLSEITLLDIYNSIGKPELFSFGFNEQNSECLIEKHVNESLLETITEAKKALLKSFSEINVGSISNDLDGEFKKYKYKK